MPVTDASGEPRKPLSPAERQRRYAATGRHADVQREYARRHAETVRAGMRRRRREQREKHDARQAVKRAVRTGRLVPGPCERAGGDCRGRIEAHHDDYSKQLDVRWLCARHHKDEHAPARLAA